MDPIPQAEWCTCDPKKEVEGKTYPPKQGEGKAARGFGGATEAEEKIAKLTGVGDKPDS